MFPRSREQTILNYFFISTQRVESMIGVVCVWVCDWVCDWVFYIVTGLCLGKKNDYEGTLSISTSGPDA